MIDYDGPEQLPALSAGVASYPHHGVDKDTLLKHADEALYSAKHAGRNQVAVYETADVVAAADITEPPELTIVPTSEVTPIQLRGRGGIRILVIDDQPNLRMLLRTTFEIIDVQVDEAGSAAEAMQRLAERTPDVIVLDVALPDVDGLSLCRRLRAQPSTAEVPIVLLTGSSDANDEEGRAAGADAFVHKPFSPLELLEIIEQVAGGLPQGPFRRKTEERPEEQLLLYAQDLRRLLEVERGQRLLLQSAYEETVSALRHARSSRRTSARDCTRARVATYAAQLAGAVDPKLLADQSVEVRVPGCTTSARSGFPTTYCVKPGPLTDAERRVMETHTILGEQMLDDVSLLQGEGLKIIRSHHERWDGTGYPDRLAGRGDRCVRAHRRRCRHARRDDVRPSVSEGKDLERGSAGDRRPGRAPVRPRRGRRVPGLRAAASAHLLRARCRLVVDWKSHDFQSRDLAMPAASAVGRRVRLIVEPAWTHALDAECARKPR